MKIFAAILIIIFIIGFVIFIASHFKMRYEALKEEAGEKAAKKEHPLIAFFSHFFGK